MAVAVAYIVLSQADPFTPIGISELVSEVHIRSTEANALAVDAWEVGLAAYPRAEPGIERVVPHVQLPDRRCVDHRKEVDGRHRLAIRARHFVGYIDNVLIGANPAVRRNDVIRKLRCVHLQAPARMSRTADGPLLFGPPQC